MGQAAQTEIKALALSVLAACRAVPLGNGVGTDTTGSSDRPCPISQSASDCETLPAACGSPACAGCYVVDPESGAKIHPPKCGKEYQSWLERWQPKGKTQ